MVQAKPINAVQRTEFQAAETQDSRLGAGSLMESTRRHDGCFHDARIKALLVERLNFRNTNESVPISAFQGDVRFMVTSPKNQHNVVFPLLAGCAIRKPMGGQDFDLPFGEALLQKPDEPF